MFGPISMNRHHLTQHPDAFPDVPWMECSHTGCEYRNKYKQEMKAHEMWHTKPFVCDQCGHTFATNYLLGKHMSTHDPSLKVRCEWPGCDKSFVYETQLKKHMNTHTGETVYPCKWPGCERTFLSKSYLGVHEMRHKGIRVGHLKCQWTGCEYRTHVKATLARHVLNTHQNGSEVVSKRMTNECNLMDRRVKRPKK
ncbi:unnamed protein product [Oppiella nova]|uniref:C2H2-type domain-containing protein n=1 Tax=Oppiella nova TaxID=334625 RepID=A0A7R9MGP4_9ACAR|nr:unnamed protein product [Oppiella nova]CAG2175891.1 unnamed protein product [Oppiella nova]